MIVDTSAVIAILRGEAEGSAIANALQKGKTCRMSAANYFETAVVTDSNRNPVLSRRLDDLLRDAAVVIEPVTLKQAQIAREAYRDFGKGRHRAGLNFGDCFAYALAKEKGEPLLFKGDDFCHTDIEPA
ncbi:MAG TPA: type II toxin-antitoxin system VapC family toxin [Candidatus Aquilonibacter sp.]|nr:type II toxin-antitoxin system VapC family toxin [Candidatus Aquilonibacter sp.]